jgi:hypothetical protein
MKPFQIILKLGALLLVFTMNAQNHPINFQLHVKNTTDMDFESGKLEIVEIGKKVWVLGERSQTFELPQKGKYTLRFSAEGFVAHVQAPKRFKMKNNVVTLTLMNPLNLMAATGDLMLKNPLDIETIAVHWKKDQLQFYGIGIHGALDVSWRPFKQNYGVSLKYYGCADSHQLPAIKKHNRLLAAFLDSKFGESWREFLIQLPYGVVDY